MPAFSTHYIFCEEMKSFLTKNADFKLNYDAVRIGTQGPDIFFFHRICPWMIGKSFRKIGSALHRTKPAMIFDTLAKFWKENPNNDIAKSYIYGFILHYALDRNCHPFVYYMQEKVMDKNRQLHKSSAHNYVEFAMDSYLLQKRMHIDNTKTFETAKTITQNHKVTKEIAKVVAYLVNNVTDYFISEKDVETAIADTRVMQEILHDKNDNLQKSLLFLEKIFGSVTKYFKPSSMLRPKDLENAKKYGNINNALWRSPYDIARSRNESFEDLFEFAQIDAKELINGFNEIVDGKNDGASVTNNISFLTGVTI